MTTATGTSRVTYRVGHVSDIPPGEGRTFRVGDMIVAVFRTREGEILATQANCPHQGGPLADGLVGNGLVICPLHGYRFRLASGEPVGNDCAALQTFPVSVDPAGEIFLAIGD